MSPSTLRALADSRQRARSIVHPYLLRAVATLRTVFFLSTKEVAQHEEQLVETTSWVFVGVFLLASLLYWPAVASLNEPLAAARQILALIPQQTIARNAVLKLALQQIARQ